MLEIKRTNQFKKDVKRMLRRNADAEKLKKVIDLI